MNKQETSSIMTLVLMILSIGTSLLLLSSCANSDTRTKKVAVLMDGSGNPIDPANPNNPVDPNNPVVDPPLNEGPMIPVVGITSGRAILKELAGESGVPNYSANTAITGSFTKVETSLSGSGDGLALSSDMAMAILELAAQFCLAAVTRENALANVNDPARRLFTGVNLAAATPAAGVRAVAGQMLNTLAQRFWQRAPSAEELARLQTLVTNLPVAATAQGNRDLAVSVCAVVGGSLASVNVF